MPLLTTPLAQITYEQVIDFCRTFPEGVRVEYKREPGKNTPKVVSSFANTVGGVWVIGVDADKKTNMAILPPAGLKREPGIEKRLTQSALTGVYPGITPDVRVFDIPNQADRVIVVVRVVESVEAPHAIENSTRVYVRNVSTTEPYELADIDRIEYLLKRRNNAEAHRESLIERAATRSSYSGQGVRVRVVVSPTFPRGMLFSRDELYERAELLKQMHDKHLENFRLVHEAIASSPRTAHQNFYFECSVDGVVFYEASVEARNVMQTEVSRFKVVALPALLVPLGESLKTATALLKGSLTNLLIRYELYGLHGLGFLPPRPKDWWGDSDEVVAAWRCVDPRVTVETTAIADELVDGRARILIRLFEDVLWAFNFRSSEIPAMVTETAMRMHLV